MQTLVLEGIVTALTSICHNGGEQNGTTIQLRREKFIQEDGEIVDVPIISGNAIRGTFRDIFAKDVLTKENGDITPVDANIFNLLFSGGSLSSTGSETLNLEKIRELRKGLPMLSVLGCSVGNIIIQGKLKVGMLIPICLETKHLIPSQYVEQVELKSIWEYCQVVMYTRKDDQKIEMLQPFLQGEKKEKKEGEASTQMMYNIETLAAGVKFYWKITLEDTTEAETGAFLDILNKWSSLQSQVGGNGRIGHGSLKLEIKETKTIDSELDFKNPEFVKFIDAHKKAKKDINNFIGEGKIKTLF